MFLNTSIELRSEGKINIWGILAFALIVCLVAGSYVVIRNEQNKLNQLTASFSDESTTQIPRDFFASLDWGECRNDTPRTHIEINAQKQGYVLFLNSDQQSGRESTFELSHEQLFDFYGQLIANNVWQLPSEIKTSEEIIVLDSECSHLELIADNQRKVIDEANGINSDYYTIKELFKQLITH